MTYITANTTVQTAIKQLDTALIGVGTSANYWQRNNSDRLSPTTITDSLGIGSTVASTAMLWVPGTTNNNAWFNLGTGKLGVGTTAPGTTLGIVGGVGIGTSQSFANAGVAANNLAVQGSVGIGTTSPYSSTSTLGVVGGIAIGTTATYSNKQTPAGGLLVEGNVGIATTSPLSALDIRTGNLGVGTPMAAAYKIDVNGDVRVAVGSDYYVGVIGLNDNTTSSSGSSLVGLYDDTMTYITANTTVQTAIKQLDTAIVGVGTSANYWQRNNSDRLSPTTITDSIGIGSTVASTAILWVPGTTSNNAWFNLGAGKLGVGTTAPGTTLGI